MGQVEAVQIKIGICSERLLKEAFLRDGENFSGRPTLFVHESCWGRGQVISDGARNAEVRRFLMTQMKQREQWEPLIQDNEQHCRKGSRRIGYRTDHEGGSGVDGRLVDEQAAGGTQRGRPGRFGLLRCRKCPQLAGHWTPSSA